MGIQSRKKQATTGASTPSVAQGASPPYPLRPVPSRTAESIARHVARQSVGAEASSSHRGRQSTAPSSTQVSTTVSTADLLSSMGATQAPKKKGRPKATPTKVSSAPTGVSASLPISPDTGSSESALQPTVDTTSLLASMGDSSATAVSPVSRPSVDSSVVLASMDASITPPTADIRPSDVPQAADAQTRAQRPPLDSALLLPAEDFSVPRGGEPGVFSMPAVPSLLDEDVPPESGTPSDLDIAWPPEWFPSERLDSTPLGPLVPPGHSDLRAVLHEASLTAKSEYRIHVEVAARASYEASVDPTFVSTVAAIDDGCMDIIVSRDFYQFHKAILGALQPTSLLAQTADSRFQRFDGQLELVISAAGVDHRFRALVMVGHFNILLGKPWLHANGAVHLYAPDWLYVANADASAFIPVPKADATVPQLVDPIEALTSIQVSDLPGRVQTFSVSVAVEDDEPPLPVLLEPASTLDASAIDDEWSEMGFLEPWVSAGEAELVEGRQDRLVVQVRSVSTIPATVVEGTTVPPHRQERRMQWQPYYPFGSPVCSPDRAQKVLSLVSIGGKREDGSSILSDDQFRQVQDLVTSFQHIFGLGPKDLASNRLIEFDIEVDPGVKPYRSARIPPMTLDDHQWLTTYCHNLLDAGVLRHVDPSQVEWCSEIKIVPKGKGHYAGTSMEVLKDLANDGLRKAGLPFDPTRPPPDPANLGSWSPPSGRRLVHNYRPLNQATLNVTSFPSSNMDHKVTQLAGHRLYSTADMMSGYFALSASPRAQSLLTFFVEGIGYLTYTRMPFGPTEGPTRYNHFGSRAFGHLESAAWADIGGRLVRWFDDLNAASDSFSEHLFLLRQIFEVCEDVGAVLSPGKTHLCSDKVMWCGNVICESGVSSDPDKVAAITQWKTPTCPMDVVRFLNTVNFFRNRAPQLAHISAPLSDLTAIPVLPNGVGRRRGARRRALTSKLPSWKWGLEEERSFALVKAAVAFLIASAIPDFTKDWFVDADAGPEAVGGALLQLDDKGKRVVIAVTSKKLSVAGKKMTQFLRELVAIRHALDKFEQWVKSGRIIVTTDCVGLRDLLNSPTLSSTYTRWVESLMNFAIVRFDHRPGSRNLLCDGLSRCPLPDDSDASPVLESWEDRQGWLEGDECPPASPTALCTYAPHDVHAPAARFAVDIISRYNNGFTEGVVTTAIHLLTVDPCVQDLVDKFRQDALYPVLWFLLTTELEGSLAQRAWVRRSAASFYVSNGCLLHVTRSGTVLQVVPAAVGRALVSEAHQLEGHFGRDLLLLHFHKKGLYWWDMRNIIQQEVSSCQTCQHWGPRHMAALMGPVLHPQPFDLIAADFLSLPNASGDSHLLVFVDYFSRFVWAFVCSDTGDSVAAALAQFVTIAAVPRRLLTDNGSHFVNSKVTQMCKDLGIAHSTVPVYAPWVNGLVERQNGLIVQQLRKLCHDTLNSEWPRMIHIAVRNINRRVLPDVGYRPQELLFGVIEWGAYDAPVHPWDGLPDLAPGEDVVQLHQTLIEHVRDNAMALRAEKIRATDPEPAFQVDDLVMLRAQKRDGKLAPLWHGPYVVTKTDSASASLRSLMGEDLPFRHHFSNMRHFNVASNLGEDDVG